MIGARNLLPLIAVIGSLQLPQEAAAQASRYEEPIRYRQAVMTLVKRHYDQASGMAKGKLPFNREELNRHAAYLDMLSRISLDGFVAGSHEGNTRARPEIWKEWARYRGMAEKFQAETARLKEVARAGSPDAVKAVVADLTTVCKNCHDDFKEAAVGG
jgi:cytochrome c556